MGYLKDSAQDRHVVLLDEGIDLAKKGVGHHAMSADEATGWPRWNRKKQAACFSVCSFGW
jgi:hypothetical protein